MRIAIAHAAPMRLWQKRLAETLRRHGHEVVLLAGPRRRLGKAVVAALALEQRLLGPRPSLFDTISTTEGQSIDRSTEGELVIVLDGVHADASLVLEPLFDGAPGDTALLAMLRTGHPPRVEVRAEADGEAFDVVIAHLAVGDRDVLSNALDQVLARIVTLIVQGVGRIASGQRATVDAGAPRLLPRTSPLPDMARGWLRKIAGRMPGARRGPSHWCIAYRRLDGVSGTGTSRCWPAHRFTLLPDDGARFYADPVPFVEDGRTFLFLEDYPYATAKGVIGVTEIEADGTASPVRTVLEQPSHLSYPFLVRHCGEIYMMPEMSAARRVQLFRAAPFPDRWVADQVLLDGVCAADATLIQHDGRWWMFATLADDGGSSWDQLALFHASDLFGPWMPHGGNPVLVDAGAARPAGAMWHAADGTLMRVAQDCRTGYGVGVAICRVDRLDEQDFAQTVVARLGAPESYGADGVHTLDGTAGVEVIDLRFPPASR